MLGYAIRFDLSSETGRRFEVLCKYSGILAAELLGVICAYLEFDSAAYALTLRMAHGRSYALSPLPASYRVKPSMRVLLVRTAGPVQSDY